ncbi:hypothetical protein ACP70R_045505 [Stipagrostis hirtigluma subsp. patula]
MQRDGNPEGSDVLHASYTAGLCIGTMLLLEIILPAGSHQITRYLACL